MAGMIIADMTVGADMSGMTTTAMAAWGQT